MSRVSIYLIAMAMISVSLVSCSSNETEADVLPGAAREAVRVKIEIVEPSMFHQKITLPGAAKAAREVIVSAEVASRVIKLGFDKGDAVSAGKNLVWLDSMAADANLAQAKAARDIAELNYKKIVALKEANAAVSQFELDTKRLNLAEANARVSAAYAMKKKHLIKAPIGGIVVTRDVEVGTVVGPGASITKIVDIDPIKIVVGVPETTVTDFAIGKEANVTFDAYPNKTFGGEVTFLSPEVDSRARVFPCELTIDNRDGKILPEMSAKVFFIRKERKDSILIPQTAILEMPNFHAVFIVDDEGVAHQEVVTIADRSGEQALISSGVNAADKLVVTGHRSLLDGDRVEIIE